MGRLRRGHAEDEELRIRTQRQLGAQIASEALDQHPEIRSSLGQILNDLKRPVASQVAGPSNLSVTP